MSSIFFDIEKKIYDKDMNNPSDLLDELIIHGASSRSNPLRTLVNDPLAVDAAIAMLRKFSLVRQRTGFPCMVFVQMNASRTTDVDPVFTRSGHS